MISDDWMTISKNILGGFQAFCEHHHRFFLRILFHREKFSCLHVHLAHQQWLFLHNPRGLTQHLISFVRLPRESQRLRMGQQCLAETQRRVLREKRCRRYLSNFLWNLPIHSDYNQSTTFLTYSWIARASTNLSCDRRHSAIESIVSTPTGWPGGRISFLNFIAFNNPCNAASALPLIASACE